MSPQILNPEFILQTLNAEIFKSEEFCRVIDFLPNPDIFSASVVTKLAVAVFLNLSLVQAINCIMGNAILLI